MASSPLNSSNEQSTPKKHTNDHTIAMVSFMTGHVDFAYRRMSLTAGERLLILKKYAKAMNDVTNLRKTPEHWLKAWLDYKGSRIMEAHEKLFAAIEKAKKEEGGDISDPTANRSSTGQAPEGGPSSRPDQTQPNAAQMAAPNESMISIVSYNCSIESVGKSAAYEYINELCEHNDIVVLQETWLKPEELDNLRKSHSDFESFAKSSMPENYNSRGRNYGGLAILCKKGRFRKVEEITISDAMKIKPIEEKTNVTEQEIFPKTLPPKDEQKKETNPYDRFMAIHVEVDDLRSFLLINIYMPFFKSGNSSYEEFNKCLEMLRDIINNCKVQAVFVIGDFNARPNELFGIRLLNFCDEQSWICADVIKLDINSETFTFSNSKDAKSWLDHCVTTEAAWNTIYSIDVVEQNLGHSPLLVLCDLDKLKEDGVINNENPTNAGEEEEETTETETTEEDVAGAFENLSIAPKKK